MKLSPKLNIDPVDYASQGNAILGIRDSGKTYTATFLAEQLMDAGIPIIVFDPIGIWRNLKVGKSGKGYAVVVAGDDGDLPLTADTAAEIVRAAMQENISLVVDLYSMALSKADWRKIVEQSIRLLLYENKTCGLRHIFIEEAAEFCLPPDTEVLTPNGWCKGIDLIIGDLVVGFDPAKNTYQYEPVQAVQKRHHNGKMIPLKTARLDALVTPDHRVLLKRWQHDARRYKEYEWTFCPANTLPHAFFVPNGGAPIGEGISDLTLNTARVLGWMITDGHRLGRIGTRNANYLRIEQSVATTKRGINIASEFEKAFSAIGITKRIRNRVPRVILGNSVNSDKSHIWYLGVNYSKELLKWLEPDIHRIPRRLLIEASKEQLEALWLGLMEGDGTSESGRWRYFYAGLSESLADDVQELATKLGIRTIKRLVPQNGQWRLSIGDQRHYYVRRRKPVNYDGAVWDITVPSGAFVARRNGTVFVTGNCPQRVKPEEGKVYAEIEKLARMGGNASLGYTLINQRAEEVSKAVLELCDTLFLHRQKGRHSLTALGKWLDVADTSNAAEVVKSLPSLAQGECWVWQEGSHIPEKVKIPEKKTVHPDRKNPLKTSAGISADVSEFVAKMHRSLSPKEYLELPGLQKWKKSRLSAPADIDLREKDQEIVDLKLEIAKKDKWIARLEAGMRIHAVTFQKIRDLLPGDAPALPEVEEVPPENWQKGMLRLSAGQKLSNSSEISKLPSLSKCAKAILTFLAPYDREFSKVQVGIAIGYSPGAGHFNNSIGELVSNDLIIRGKGLRANRNNLDAIADIIGPVKKKKYDIESFKEKLGKCERELYQILLEHPRRQFSKESIAGLTESRYSPTAGHFNNAIGRLASLELLIRENGTLFLNPDLAKML